jgi:4-hydroxybenzoate polyprenyltransferase/phosphoserine phosphatase
MADGDQRIPLCVDLDGTLIRTDTLHEALLLLAKGSPRALPALPLWLAGGKAKLKHLVAERVELHSASLPYCEDVLALIAEARERRRPIVLVTAAPARVANAIARSLGVFDDVLTSDESLNLSHTRKADALVSRYGSKGFDYVGNSADDLPVFERCRRAFLVSSKQRLRSAAGRRNQDVTFVDSPSGGLRTWMKALRVHQWLKNLLVFVPLLASGRFRDPHLAFDALLAFGAFSLFASAVYLVNDMVDLQSDRLHRTKRNRPFASGALAVSAGIAAVPILMVAAVAIAFFLPRLFLLALLGYAAVTTVYSFALKRQVVVDVMLLAGLYTMRILAGSAATNIEPSFWLLAFSMFLFLCLAMTKRYSELRQAIEQDRMLSGRGYLPADLPVVLALGAGSGLVSVLILALYTQSLIVPDLYPAAEWIWLVPPLLLYWVARLWLKAGRGEIDDDPVLFAARDWQSLTIAAIAAILFLLAGSGWWPL